ncbi:MAG: NADH-quinone oxidoreductase subunit J [Gemmatimonadales bacterium]
MNIVTITWWIFAGWAVISALLCVTRRNPISSVLWLVSCMFALAGIYVLLQAEFIAAVQVLVYAGAVMVLFLFVIMLLNIGDTPRNMKRWPMWLTGAGLSAVMLAELVALRGYTPDRLARELSTLPGNVDPSLVFPEGAAAQAATAAHGVVGGIAEPLFTSYLIPFEITSVLLLAAAIGAVVLAKKKL